MQMEIASLGNGLVRTPTKKVFRKWKPARLVLLGDRIVVHFEDKTEPNIVKLDAAMKLSNVFEQRKGSLLESKSRVYFCRLVREMEGAIGNEGKKSDIGPSPFHDEHETETIIKFGSGALDELVSFAKALDTMLTTSEYWEREGRRRIGSKEEPDEYVRDVGRRYRDSIVSPSSSPLVRSRANSRELSTDANDTLKREVASRAPIVKSTLPSEKQALWETFEYQDAFKS